MGDEAQKRKKATRSPVPSRSRERSPRDETQAGRSPEPENKHAKRSATKRLLSKATDDR
jgi:hypothetical protein